MANSSEPFAPGNEEAWNNFVRAELEFFVSGCPLRRRNYVYWRDEAICWGANVVPQDEARVWGTFTESKESRNPEGTQVFYNRGQGGERYQEVPVKMELGDPDWEEGVWF